MTTFLQDNTGDLVISSGKMALVTGGQETAQKLYNRFRLFLGEWFLDERQGIPYFARIFGVKSPDMTVITQFFSNIITTTPGVASLTSIQATFNNATREANGAFVCKAADGSTIRATSLDRPFIVTSET